MTYIVKSHLGTLKKTKFITLEGTQHVLGHTARSQVERKGERMHKLEILLLFAVKSGGLGFHGITVDKFKI